MTHADAFQILRKFSKHVHIESFCRAGEYGQGDRIDVSFSVWVWVDGECLHFEGESLAVAVGRAVADLTPPTPTDLPSLDASLKTLE